MALAALLVFTVVISLALFIALPPGFCSRRARWFRTITRTVQGAGKVLIEEIRGEEEVPIGSDDDEDDEEGGEEWVHMTKDGEKVAVRPLTSKWTKIVLNHDSTNPTPPPEARLKGEDPILLARGVLNANKSGDGGIYF